MDFSEVNCLVVEPTLLKKYDRQNGFIFPKFLRENNKYLSCHQLVNHVCVCVWFYFDMHFERYDMTLFQIVAGLQLLWQIYKKV